ncbi:unnamed protein product [Cladocopium goreaui]|uniref:Uncharacterized protein n=1 Tax=Cladocopium goreaui TaxID=2562237 RepID=A0A9P1CPW7_9DINO|nr:unnamed protein product [Cladocopium goreaui]
MHANAAGLQGQLAAAISVLDLAGGGGHFDANGALIIKAEHVQVACRLVEIALQIRHIFRLPLDDDLSDQENVERPEIPVHGNYERKFGEALATQGLPALPPEEEEAVAEAEAEEEELLPPAAHAREHSQNSVLSKCHGSCDKKQLL